MSGVRRLRAALVVLLAVLLVSTGCGVPSSSEVQYIGPGPEAGSRSQDEGRAPPRPDAATTPGDLVEYFLEAAAGSPQTAADRVREFLHSPEQDAWRPDEQIRVVRLRDVPIISDHLEGGWQVELSVLPVGELHANGYLDVATTTAPVEYSFRVLTEGLDRAVDGHPRLRIADPPPYLLLADTALANPNYFSPHLIYFWDTDHTTLVPDLRWLPKAGEPADQHPWTVFRWLLTGPAPGLARTEGLPAGTRHNGTPGWDGSRLVVNVNAAAVEGQEVDDLATQLAWSLLPLRQGASELELRIDDRPQEASVRPRPEYPDPSQFVLVGGMVRQYPSIDDPQPTPALPEELNQGLDRAALTSRGEIAALVRERGDSWELTVVRALPGASRSVTDTGVSGAALGQPMWLSASANAIGLIVADQRLYWFNTWGEAQEVVVAGLAGPIQAVAISPEQRRLAIIAGDRLYLAQVLYERDSVSVLAPRALPTSLTELAEVTFGHEQQLIVAGRKDDRVGLHQLTVDGAVETRLLDLGNAAVTGLTAYPRRGTDEIPLLMYEANGRAHSYTGAPTLIRPEDLVDPPEAATDPPYAPFFLR